MTSVTPSAYDLRMSEIGDDEVWPGAGLDLLDELGNARDRFALITGESHEADELVAKIATDLGLGMIRLGHAIAHFDRPPSMEGVIDAIGDGSVLTDLDALLWPDLGISTFGLLGFMARQRPTIAVWPGTIANDRARYSAVGRPDYLDERLRDVVVLRPRTAYFPDEVPYTTERISP